MERLSFRGYSFHWMTIILVFYLNLLINNSWTLNDSDSCAFPTFMGRE